MMVWLEYEGREYSWQAQEAPLEGDCLGLLRMDVPAGEGRRVLLTVVSRRWEVSVGSTDPNAVRCELIVMSAS